MAIAFDAASNGGSSGASNTLSWSHTCTGSNLILFVGTISSFSGQVADDITGVTYNGVAMTKSDSSALQTNVKTVSLWYLLNPASGTHTVTVSRDNANNGCFGLASSYTGVLGFDNHATTGNNSGSATFAEALTPVADNCWIVWMVGDSVSDPTAGANTTLRITGAFAHAIFDTNGPITPAASTTLNANEGASNWAGCIASFNPIVAGPPINVDVTNSLQQGVKII